MSVDELDEGYCSIQQSLHSLEFSIVFPVNCLMPAPAQLAKHLREVYFGGNWTWVNLKTTLDGLSWKHAVAKIDGLNTIAALTYHIHYFVRAILPVLQGGQLTSKDSESFDHPAFHSQEEWDDFVQTIFNEAEQLAGLIERLPESKLDEVFEQEKYGSYFRNILGLIEHTHYHLGQITIVRKMLEQRTAEHAH
jgi:hypothetical protein